MKCFSYRLFCGWMYVKFMHNCYLSRVIRWNKNHTNDRINIYCGFFLQLKILVKWVCFGLYWPLLVMNGSELLWQNFWSQCGMLSFFPSWLIVMFCFICLSFFHFRTNTLFNAGHLWSPSIYQCYFSILFISLYHL